jgi:putative thioredoxin
MAPEGAKDPDIDAVRAALTLAAEAPSETAEFEARLAAAPDDHEARFEVAKAQAGHGRWQEAVDNLLTIIEKDRTWNEDAARRQLLTIFDAAGAGSDITRQGRRRLSSILFS